MAEAVSGCEGEAGGKRGGRDGKSAVESVYIDNFQQHRVGISCSGRRGRNAKLTEREKDVLSSP